MLLTIAEIAAEAGITTARIRQWENRFGWPVAKRDRNGHRRYSADLAPALREAARRSDSGRSLRNDIVDGVPVWLAHPRSAPRQTRYDLKQCSLVQEPRTPEGQRLRAALMQALTEQNETAVSAALARLPTIHPSDRASAVLDVLRIIGHPRAIGVEAANTSQPGSDVSQGELAATSSAETADQMTAAVHQSALAVEAVQAVAAGSSLPAIRSDPVRQPVAPAPVEAEKALSRATRRSASKRRTVSDDTTAAWQVALARHATERRHQQDLVGGRKTRSESFRHLRDMLDRGDAAVVNPPSPALAEDALALQVHEAPLRIRKTLVALLGTLLPEASPVQAG